MPLYNFVLSHIIFHLYVDYIARSASRLYIDYTAKSASDLYIDYTTRFLWLLPA